MVRTWSRQEKEERPFSGSLKRVKIQALGFESRDPERYIINPWGFFQAIFGSGVFSGDGPEVLFEGLDGPGAFGLVGADAGAAEAFEVGA